MELEDFLIPADSVISEPNLKGTRDLLSWLAEISAELGLDLRYPKEVKVDATSTRNTELLAAGIKHGRIAVPPMAEEVLSVSLPKPDAAKLVLAARSDGIPEITAVRTAPYSIFGLDIMVTPVRMIFQGVRPVDLDETARLIEKTPDEQVIPLQLTYQRVIHEFQRWMPSAKNPPPKGRGRAAKAKRKVGKRAAKK